MAFTQSDLDAINAAIATGAREVEFGAGPDRRKVVYRSLSEMLAVRDEIARELSPSSGEAMRTVGVYCG